MTDYRIYRLTLRDRIREGSAGALVCILVCLTFYRSTVLLFSAVPAVFIVYPMTQKKKLREKRMWELTLEFKEAIWIVSGFLNAGISVENACSRTLAELKKIYGDKAMITKEFSLIVRGLQLNTPVEILLKDFADRSGLEDVRNFEGEETSGKS